MRILTEVMNQEKESACRLCYYSSKFSFKDSFSALYFLSQYLQILCVCVHAYVYICYCVDSRLKGYINYWGRQTNGPK